MICTVGCTDCCEQLFHISEPEADHIRAHLLELPSEARNQLTAQAKLYLADRKTLLAAQGLVESRGALLPARRRLACPALADGSCQIYSARPLLCRRFGGPVWRPAEPGRLYACEKNFRSGEAIDDPALRARQGRLATLRQEMEAAYERSGAPRDAEPLTVAHALL